MMIGMRGWCGGAMMMGGMLLCGCGEKKQAASEEKAAKVVEEKAISLVSSFRVKRTEAEGEMDAISSNAVAWMRELMVVVTAENSRVQAFNAKSGEEVWKAEFDEKVAAIGCSERDVYVALNSMPVMHNREWLRRLEGATGKDDTPPAIPQPDFVREIMWSEELQQLCVVEAQKVSLYARDLMNVKKRIPFEGLYPRTSTDRRTILLTELGGNCRVVDVKAGTVEYIYGPPSNVDNWGVLAKNGPILVDAFYHASEGRLIRHVDTLQGKARLFIHESPGSGAREVETGMDRARAAVHWPTRRVAVAGTGQSLLLFSTKGDLLEELKGEVDDEPMADVEDEVPEGVAALAFSPSGKQLAVMDYAGWVKVYEVP